MLRQACTTAAVVLALCACQRQAPPQPSAASVEQASAAVSDLPLNEFMTHVVEYNADNIWRWQGHVSDEKGERSLLPTTTQQWEQAESAALTLTELTYPLVQPGRRREGANWDRHVLELRAVAQAAAKAAEVHDRAGYSAAGDRLAAACASCHYDYAPQLEGPRPK